MEHCKQGQIMVSCLYLDSALDLLKGIYTFAIDTLPSTEILYYVYLLLEQGSKECVSCLQQGWIKCSQFLIIFVAQSWPY